MLNSDLCEPVTFTLDATPPAIDFVRPDGLPRGALPRVRVTDENLGNDGVRVLLDGRSYDPTLPVVQGEHLVEVTAEDAAGNVATASTTFVQQLLICDSEVWIEYVRPTSKLSATFYFPWYTQSANCPVSSKWCNCVWSPKPQNPRPALGFYGSDVQSTVNSQLDQMVAYGIDVVALEWSGFAQVTNNILNKVVPAIALRNLKFVLLYDASVRLANANPPINFDRQSVRDTFISDFQAFASNASYFKHAKYLKFGNEPVIYFFVTRAVSGSSANVTSAFTAASQAAIDNGFSGLYLVADHLFWGPTDWTLLSWMNPRAITSFAPVNPDQGIPSGNPSVRPIRQWADKMAALYVNARNAQTPSMPLVDLDPGIFIQWNNKGLDSAACFSVPQIMQFNLLDGSDWSYMIQTAGLDQAYNAELHILKPSCNETVIRTPANGTSIVWTYSYNEWFEGAGVEQLDTRSPAYPYGFGLQPLQTLKQKLP